jgi:hypothetical protein
MTDPVEGKLLRDECGRWCIEAECVLTSGSVVQIRINDCWLQGRIEFWRGDYHWFSTRESVCVLLRPGMVVRSPTGTAGFGA